MDSSYPKTMVVKETESSHVLACKVKLSTETWWRGRQYQIVTGSCSYYTSTRMIYPCASAAMQRISMDIDNINNVHPFYRLWYHPLWNEALKCIQLSDYNDSPFYSGQSSLDNTPTTSNSANTTIRNLNADDVTLRHNSEIFEKKWKHG